MNLFTVKRLKKVRDVHNVNGLADSFLGPDGSEWGVALERDPSDPLHPCIPAGLYKLICGVMATTGHKRALLVQVPNGKGGFREGIFVHSVNFIEQGLGCICVGRTFVESGEETGGMSVADRVYASVVANPDSSFIDIADNYLEAAA